jgi:hypothetical protein
MRREARTKKDVAGHGWRQAPATPPAEAEVSPSLYDNAPPDGAADGLPAAIPPRAEAWLATLGRIARRCAVPVREAGHEE